MTTTELPRTPATEGDSGPATARDVRPAPTRSTPLLRIVVFGGSGRIGRRITAEAHHRGHDVTVVCRSTPEESINGADHIRGDMADSELVERLARTSDVVVSATGPGHTPDELGAFRRMIDAATDHLVGTRMMVIGGAGTLITEGRTLAGSGTLSSRSEADAEAHIEVLHDLYLAPSFVDWTYLTPPPQLIYGSRTGTYITGTNNPAGQYISAEDLAVAAVDELETPAHRRARFTVAATTAPVRAQDPTTSSLSM